MHILIECSIGGFLTCPILRIIGRTLIDLHRKRALIAGRWSNGGSLKPPTARP
jgi:hypothetical protein